MFITGGPGKKLGGARKNLGLRSVREFPVLIGSGRQRRHQQEPSVPRLDFLNGLYREGRTVGAGGVCLLLKDLVKLCVGLFNWYRRECCIAYEPGL